MAYAWAELLTEWNAFALASSMRARAADDLRGLDWLGFPPATEEQIGALENRLGTPLPASYREFLACTNGWRCAGPFIDRVWGTDKVEWFATRNQDWIDAYADVDAEPISDEQYFVYGEAQDPVLFRHAYMQAALEVSDVGDSAIMLLNPKVVFDGEWEAWFFANWVPGAHRFRSFWDLMIDQYESAQALQ